MSGRHSPEVKFEDLSSRQRQVLHTLIVFLHTTTQPAPFFSEDRTDGCNRHMHSMQTPSSCTLPLLIGIVEYPDVSKLQGVPIAA